LKTAQINLSQGGRLPVKEKELGTPEINAMAARRFPPPWSVEQLPGGYVVMDAKGQSLGHFCRSALVPEHH
jgi:hypothetical protein